MQGETAVRLACFALAFGAVAAGEGLAARRPLTTARWPRWTGNLSIMLINPLLVRLLFPVLAVSLAVAARRNGWGLLHHLDWPYAAEWVAAVVLLDLAIYLQHVIFHAVPLLWRLHMVHHTDLDCDLTTGLRFHPLEAALSMVIKLCVVAVLGPPVRHLPGSAGQGPRRHDHRPGPFSRPLPADPAAVAGAALRGGSRSAAYQPPLSGNMGLKCGAAVDERAKMSTLSGRTCFCADRGGGAAGQVRPPHDLRHASCCRLPAVDLQPRALAISNETVIW